MAIELVKQTSTLEQPDEGGRILTEVHALKGATDIVSAANLPDLPKRGDRHPLYPTYVAGAPVVDSIEGGVDHFRFTIVWVDAVFVDDEDEVEAPVAQVTRSLTAINAWRIDGGDKTGGSVLFPADDSDPVQGEEGDIQGFGVGGREPVDKLIYQQVLRISKTVESITLADELLWESLQGTRNVASWRNRRPGAVLFTGVDSNDRGVGRIQLDFEFVVDQWLHLRQVPTTDPAGEIILMGADLATSSIGEGKAKIVNWYQEFPLKTNFALLGVGS